MITKTLADFTASLSYDRLTPVSVDMAKKCILDWLGVSIRGSQERPAKLIRQTILCNEAKQATVFDGGQSKASVFDAAFCNGAASHTLDFDDLHNPSIIHLATVVVPGVFAIAEAEHKSGRQMIAAVCAGYEAGGRIGESVIPDHISSGILQAQQVLLVLLQRLLICCSLRLSRRLCAMAVPVRRQRDYGSF